MAIKRTFVCQPHYFTHTAYVRIKSRYFKQLSHICLINIL